jgi:hypothetical protein
MAEAKRAAAMARQIIRIALATHAARAIVGAMDKTTGKIWKVISSTERMGGGGPPLKEYFLVAISDQANALGALRYKRPDIERSALSVVGEADSNYEWLGVKDGDIVCLQAV